MEANLFQVFIKSQSDLIIRAIIIRRLNFKTEFKIEIEPKSSIINIISILKTRHKRKLNDASNSRILRSLLKLMGYNFTVAYIPGSHSEASDFFSHHLVDNPDKSDETHGKIQTFILQMYCLSQAQKAESSFRLERIRNTAENDLEYQLSL